MTKKISEQQINDFFSRGVSEVIGENLKGRILGSKKLRVKYGIDPTSPDIHLGHTVALHKLRFLKSLGHKIVIIIGDYTASIGDPTGKTQTRKHIELSDVKKNLNTYTSQIAKILPLDDVEIRFQSEWYKDFTLDKTLDLLSKVTKEQIMAHGTFRERDEKGQNLGLHEMIYPVLQAYDSIMLDANLEFGGVDQMFNFTFTRQLQQKFNKEPESVILLKYLPGSNGDEKMSKSQMNYISVNDSCKDMYFKVMGIPDSVMKQYFDLLSDMSEGEINHMFAEIKQGVLHPIDVKKKLAKLITGTFFSANEIDSVSKQFESEVQKKEVPRQIPQLKISVEDSVIVNALVLSKLSTSKSEARRLIQSKSIKIDNKVVENPNQSLDLQSKPIVSRANKRFVQFIQK